MLQPPTKFEFRRRHTFGFSINQPGYLDLLTSNLVRVIARGVGNSPTNFGVSGTFPSRHMGCQTDHMTLRPFNLGGHGACRWYGSLCSIGVASLKFICLSVWKIWHISGLSISRSGDLDLWPWNWCHYCPWGSLGNLPTNFGVSRPFRSRLIDLTDASRDLATLTIDLGGTGACCCYESS